MNNRYRVTRAINGSETWTVHDTHTDKVYPFGPYFIALVAAGRFAHGESNINDYESVSNITIRPRGGARV